ncbi:3',5'-cyclic-AMP phosphodiesterase [Rheinheimera maricola]|nr:3',5'-cyclic-AMP phosphodiesterase [Rheinheimera maricola]
MGLSLKLIQISDPHLFAAIEGSLLGMNTLHSLHCVTELICQQHKQIDCLLVSGDLSQDGSVASYRHLQQALEHFNCKVLWFEGNHDNPASMQQVAVAAGYLQRVVCAGRWQLILLNSQVDGAVFGQLDESQLQLLEQALQQQPELHTLISLHHHPLPMGSAWLDDIGLQNAAEFNAIVQRYPQVRGVLWGHVHQHSDRNINGVRYLSSPSTCVQFKPSSAKFALDNQPPGYRWLTLHDDGSIDTGVGRVSGIDFSVDLAGTGY